MRLSEEQLDPAQRILREIGWRTEKIQEMFQSNYWLDLFSFGKTKRGALIGSLIPYVLAVGAGLGLVLANLGPIALFAIFIPLLSSLPAAMQKSYLHAQEKVLAMLHIVRLAGELKIELEKHESPFLVQARTQIDDGLNSDTLRTFVKEAKANGRITPGGIFGDEHYKPRFSYLLRYLSFLADESYNQIRGLLREFGKYDSLLAQAKANHYYGLTMPQIKSEADAPIYMENFWPLLDKDEIVTNTLVLGSEVRTVLLTGATFSGKSAVSRWFPLACIFMGQNGFGVPAQTASYPCFQSLITNINDEDSLIRGESGFTSHASSQRDIIGRAQQNMQKKRNTLVVMDEIWRITNPIESISLALALIKVYFSPNPFMRAFVTTHYAFIPTWLAENSVPGVKDLCMLAYERDGKPVFTYKIAPGISGDQLSIPLLREMGFDDRFIAEAERIKAELMLRTHKSILGIQGEAAQ
jgi:hypothetical protein